MDFEVPPALLEEAEFPDVHALFVYYNELYFEGKLGACSVEWSTNRMTLCAGVCHFQKHGGCRIKLSEPLLKLRPVKDLKETLLHEMIHAYLFLQNIRDGPDGHGPNFQAKMKFINEAAFPDYQRPSEGYKVTVYHTMHAEVDNYRRHWWKCDRCEHIVKRAMNRRPQEADCRGRMGKGSACADPQCNYHMHIKKCGGEFIKIKEPEPQPKKTGSKAGSKAGKAGARAGSSSAAGSSAGGAAADGKGRPAAAAAAAGTATGVIHQPAKKPKLHAGEQRITNFFGKPSAPAGAGAAADTAGADAGQAAAASSQQPAAGGAAGKEGGARQGKGSQQQEGGGSRGAAGPCSEPFAAAACAAELRRQCAEAALRRLQGGTAETATQAADAMAVPQQQQQQQQQQQGAGQKQRGAPSNVSAGAAGLSSSIGQPSDAVVLLDDDDNDESDDDGAGDVAGSQAVEEVNLVDSEGEAAPAQVLTCPVCCQQWVAGDISNQELNAHVDECLSLMA